MHRNLLILLLFAIARSSVFASGPPRNKTITRITQESVRGRHGGGRLSLINYRYNRPKRKHLDAGELKLVLGSDYDPRFMSVEDPRGLAGKDSGPLVAVNKEGRQFREIVEELDAANLTQQLRNLTGGSIPFSHEQVRVVEKWLLKKASCPVRYAWEDIGALFWPRYVRRGECHSEPGTCSWPPGMLCVPSGTTHVHILRWQCKTPRGGRGRNRKALAPSKESPEENKNIKCKWVRVPYPITTECMCTC